MFLARIAQPMTIQTPCTKVCTIDPRCGLCAGCGRTLDEIARWSVFSDRERAAIMAALPRRMATSQASDAVTARQS